MELPPRDVGSGEGVLHIEHVVVERHALEHFVLYDDKSMLDRYTVFIQIF